MKPLSPAPAPVLSLAAPPAPSALTAQVKAQKLRAQAQGKRGLGGPVGGGFQEQLRSREGSGAASQRPETASTRAEGKSHTAKAKGEQEKKDENAAESARSAGRGEGEPDAALAAGDAIRGEGNESESQPYVQEVVAQVLEGVDPALRLKPASVARASGTVAGNTAEAKRTIDVQTAAAFGGTESLQAETPTGEGGSERRLNPAATDAGEAGPTGEKVGDEPRIQRAMRRDTGAEAKQPPAASGVQTDRAAAATSSAAAAFAVPATPLRAVEQRVTLTPTLSVVSAGAGGRTVEAPKGGAEGPPRSTVAEQVEHGLKVAMQDLPAPAGERLVTLRLHPSSLGSLRISMHVSGDAVNVRFQVGSAKAKAAIGKAIDELKASIAQQGLRVDSLEIEEESALAAPETGVAGTETPLGGPQGVRASSGKGFANPLDAPRGPDGLRAHDGTGRTPIDPDAETEDGVLQVLTFRLDAVG